MSEDVLIVNQAWVIAVKRGFLCFTVLLVFLSPGCVCWCVAVWPSQSCLIQREAAFISRNILTHEREIWCSSSLSYSVAVGLLVSLGGGELSRVEYVNEDRWNIPFSASSAIPASTVWSHPPLTPQVFLCFPVSWFLSVSRHAGLVFVSLSGDMSPSPCCSLR